MHPIAGDAPQVEDAAPIAGPNEVIDSDPIVKGRGGAETMLVLRLRSGAILRPTGQVEWDAPTDAGESVGETELTPVLVGVIGGIRTGRQMKTRYELNIVLKLRSA